MRFSDAISHEWKTRLSRPAALMSLGLFVVILCYGSLSGRLERDARLEAIAAHETEVVKVTESWLTKLKALEEKGPEAGVPLWSGSAMDLTFSSYLRPAPLADFAIGQSDLLPFVGALSLWNPDIRLFSKYEFEDPVYLALGGFDFSKAVILVLPLLLIVLLFDVLSSERDANRLGLFLAQGARVPSFFWRRLVIRAGTVVGLMFLIASLALLLQGGNTTVVERLPAFVFWALCAFLYAACWVAVISFIASKNRRGEVNVMLMLSAWVTFTLIAPASVTAIAETVYPMPSRLAYLAESREKEIETERAEAAIANRFIIDHPEMVVTQESEIPAYFRTAFLVTSAVDEATKPILAAFEEAAARRDDTLELLRYVSPAIITHNLFNEITGTSSARHRRYLTEARAFKAAFAEQVGPTVVAGQRLPSEQFENLPKFGFVDQPIGTIMLRNTRPLLFLALSTGLLLFLADRRLCCIEGPDG